MKTLTHYVSEKQTKLFRKTGSFFSFSNLQFHESRQSGVDYVNVGAGLLCPRDKAEELVEGLIKITIDGIAEDVAENGVEGIIGRELANQEAYFTGDLDDTINSLIDYPITAEDVIDYYNKHL